MKKYTFFAFLLISALTISCSEEENNTPDNTVDDTEYFNYTADGEVVPVTVWTAIRTENNFEVLGQAEDGRSLFFSFNSDGDLGRARSTSATESNLPWLNSFYEFTDNYFDFNIVAIDEATKVMKVTYSGNLYESDFDLNSAATLVEGTFNVQYTDIVPAIPGKGFSAEFNGNQWKSVKHGTTVSGLDDVTLEFNSGDAYKFSLNFSDDNLVPGTYNFSNSSTPKVSLSKYDLETGTYNDYVCSGTLVITEKTAVSAMTIISGTFNFSAVNPITDDEITVTNGSFKEVYSN